MSLAKALAEHLVGKINPAIDQDCGGEKSPLVKVHAWALGDTEGGFFDSYEIDPVELEREIDQFIATFQPKAA